MAGVLAWLTLTVGAPLLALAGAVLWWLVTKYGNPVTRGQAIAVTAVFIHCVVFGLIFLNNDMEHPIIDLVTTKIITRGIEFVEAVVVALAVLWLFRDIVIRAVVWFAHAVYRRRPQ